MDIKFFVIWICATSFFRLALGEDSAHHRSSQTSKDLQVKNPTTSLPPTYKQDVKYLYVRSKRKSMLPTLKQAGVVIFYEGTGHPKKRTIEKWVSKVPGHTQKRLSLLVVPKRVSRWSDFEHRKNGSIELPIGSEKPSVPHNVSAETVQTRILSESANSTDSLQLRSQEELWHSEDNRTTDESPKKPVDSIYEWLHSATKDGDGYRVATEEEANEPLVGRHLNYHVTNVTYMAAETADSERAAEETEFLPLTFFNPFVLFHPQHESNPGHGHRLRGGKPNHFYHASEARQRQYNPLGSGNFEIVRGGIFKDDNHGPGNRAQYDREARGSYNRNYHDYHRPVNDDYDAFPFALINGLSERRPVSVPSRLRYGGTQLIPTTADLVAMD